MRLLWAVLSLAALGCAEGAEPVTERSVARRAPVRVVESGFFRMEIPAHWREKERRTDAQRSAVTAAFEAPPPDPVVRVIVGRPVRFAGNAEEFGDTQVGSLELLGFTLGRRSDVSVGRWAAHLMEGEGGRGALFAYMLVDHGAQRSDGRPTPAAVRRCRDAVAERSDPCDRGFAWTVLCGGPGGVSADRARCDAMVSSFEVTEPLDDHAPPASSPVVAGRTLELAETRFTTPEGWEPAPQLLAAVPRAIWLVRSSRLVGRSFASASLSVDPFAGSLEEYDRMSDAVSAEAGVTVVRRGETTLLEQPAIEVVEDYPAELGGHRSLTIQTVLAGRGWLLTCSGAPEEDARIREGCEIIRASLRRM